MRIIDRIIIAFSLCCIVALGYICGEQIRKIKAHERAIIQLIQAKQIYDLGLVKTTPVVGQNEKGYFIAGWNVMVKP